MTLISCSDVVGALYIRVFIIRSISESVGVRNLKIGIEDDYMTMSLGVYLQSHALLTLDATST